MSIIKDIFTVNRKTFFYPSRWIDAEGLRGTFLLLFGVVRTVITKPEAGKAESFEEAMTRLQLSEDDVAQQIKTYHGYTFIFLVAGVLALLYAFFLLFKYKTFAGWILTLSVSALFSAQAFKYDFWALQMSQRKLGLSFEDYKKFRLSDKDNI